MPITVHCPNCSAKLNAPDAAAGKRVKCPKCQTAVAIPEAEPLEVDEGPAPTPSKRRPADDEDDRPSRRRRSEEDDDREERPSKRSRREDDEEEEEDRPRRRSHQNGDEEDERPSRRRSRRDDDDDGPRQTARQLNVCGLIGLIVGIPSIIINFFPCCGGWIPGIIGGVVSLTLGVIGLLLAKKSEGRMGGGLAIAGTILGGIAVLFSLLWVILFATWIATRPTAPAFNTTPYNNDPPVGNNDPFGPGRRPVEPGGPAIKITALELAKSLDDDEAGTHAKYDGKVMEVTGTLADVTDVGGAFPVTIYTDGVGVDLKNGQKAKLATVPLGGLVTFRGRYRRDQTPLLGDGEVVGTAKHPDGTDAKLDMLKLGLEYKFDKNTGAADKKYKGKLLEVELEVKKVTRGGPQGGTLEIATDEPKAEARFPARESNTFAELKQGDWVKVRGKCAGVVNGVLVLEECVVVK